MNELLARLWRLGSLRLDPREILEARLFRPDDLPAGMPQVHRELVAPR